MATATTQTGVIPEDIEFQSPQGKVFELRVGPGPYIGKFSRMTAAPPNQWNNQVYWFWELYNTIDEDGKQKVIAAQLNEDGSIFEWRQKTSVRFGKNPKTGKMADARKNAEALLKRDVTDEEENDPRAVIQECLNKPAMLHLTLNHLDDGRSFLNLGMIEPYKKGMVAPVQRVEEAADPEALPFDGDTAPTDDDEAPF